MMRFSLTMPLGIALLAGASLSLAASNLTPKTVTAMVAAPAYALDNPKYLDLAALGDLTTAAKEGLGAYRDLATADHATGLGLKSASDASKAVLGKPKRDFIIRLDALKAFKKGGDVEALLSDTKIVHYPIVVDAKASSSLSLVKAGDKWEFIGVGDADRTVLRQSAIARSVKRFQKPEEEHFIVRVPSLNIEFTAFRNRGELQFASVTDNELAGLTAGEAEPAIKVIDRLLPLAVAHDGLPH